ncbi:ATP-dependent DNA helicase [Parachitinimonas caeni]|uniref:DNA 5'-3' helicase n=1 Tax=Parachitinimonas caeni TaxID=3031301 RepID=A0ABT7DUX9_9NEIS|nr:ATP-dependent DNA helicase [Parachitinimonas caeni]MDK2123873.1 ATP-dependent DNA helicase [Parachitinimonas caeni]
MTLDEAFAAEGALASAIAGFRPRAQQLEMAQTVMAAIEGNRVLIAEAGTGTGKTFAYLVPALLAGGKVIVSTGTKTLQDQLFSRDLPRVRDALKVPVTVALLKGRSNYVCHYHLERSVQDGRFARKEDAAQLQQIVSFARVSHTGDKAELAKVPENSPVWAHATSTRDNCLGSDCPSHKECFVLKARREALEADVVVVNHHLFFADVWLRDEGAGELLPRCNTVIFDEAHQLPEVASVFFGENVGSGQLIELARDARAEALIGAKDYVHLPQAGAALDKATRDLRLVFGNEPVRLPQHALTDNQPFHEALAVLAEALTTLTDLLGKQAERSEGLENCHKRAQELSELLVRWRNTESEDSVHWFETSSMGFQFHSTPLDIARLIQRQLAAAPRAWVFTSATLAVNGNFNHYAAEMGLWEADRANWESPFAYKQQAVLYVPKDLPEPNSAGYTRAVVEATLPLLKLSEGHAFLLFTSLRAMREAHDLLKARMPTLGLDYPLLLQGDGSRSELLDRFRRSPNAILVASQTFWEGIDVKGEQLRLVVIDKLPFAPPDDPVLAARVDKINKSGRNAFIDYQLPRAVITLKQGAGRLIRDEHDRGVLMIADPRLVEKQYGKRIWQSLPPMRRTRELAVVERFFAGPLDVENTETPAQNLSEEPATIPGDGDHH